MRVPSDDRPSRTGPRRGSRSEHARPHRPGPLPPELLDALIDAAPVGIGFWDAGLRYQRVNDALARLNGASAESHLGRTPEEVMGEMGRVVMKCLRRAIETRQAIVEQELSGNVRGRDESIQHREGSWFPVFDDSGAVVGIGGVTWDISERHALEVERLKLLEAAITARAHSQAAQVRATSMQEEAEIARREAEAARRTAEAAERMAQLAQKRTRFLMDAGARVRASMDVAETVKRLAAVAVPMLADCSYITTVDGNGALDTHAVGHADPARENQARELIERYPPRPGAIGGPAKVIATGEPELIADIDDRMLATFAEDDEHLELLRAFHIRSSLVLPLKTARKTLGALTLLMVHSGRRFSDDDVAFARALADQASLHLRNAQLYTERSHIARTLQASLLPRALPRVPGVEIAARYRPAGAQNRVGGDFYDVFESDAGAWTALLGDVAGKGAEAAAVTSLARHTLRTASLYDASPARNLATLNRALIAESATTRFCTVLCARVRPAPRQATVTFANGGHLAPRLMRADGSLEALRIAGTLVGVIPGARFEEVGLRLKPDDVVLMFTDGVTEIRTPGRDPDFGERELDRTLRGMRGATAAEVVAAVQARALEMHDGEPRDDMALLALRVVDR